MTGYRHDYDGKGTLAESDAFQERTTRSIYGETAETIIAFERTMRAWALANKADLINPYDNETWYAFWVPVPGVKNNVEIFMTFAGLPAAFGELGECKMRLSFGRSSARYWDFGPDGRVLDEAKDREVSERVRKEAWAAKRRRILNAAYAAGLTDTGHHTVRQGYQPSTNGQAIVTVDGQEWEVKGNHMEGDAHFVVGNSGQFTARRVGTEKWLHIGY